MSVLFRRVTNGFRSSWGAKVYADACSIVATARLAGQTALAAIRAAAPAYAKPGAPRAALLPFVIDAVRARATVGEVSDLLRAVWGEYRPV